MDQLDQTPRRAFLFMPVAFAGLLALWYRRAHATGAVVEWDGKPGAWGAIGA